MVSRDRLLPPALLVVFLLLLLFCVETAGRLAETRATKTLMGEGERALPLAGSALRAEIDRQRAVPTVLAEESTVRAILTLPTAAPVRRVNESLARLAGGTRASVLYLLNAQGRAVAASNYRQPDSFVGSDYRFRRYFREAIGRGRAEQYALGTVSGRPGLYISERVGPAEAPLGVVVAKVEFDRVESEWAATGRPTFVTDAAGVVLATSRPSWRFLAEAPIPPGEAEAMRERLQSRGAPLTPLPLAFDADGLVVARDGDLQGRFVRVEQALDGGPAGWRIHLLVPAEGAIRQQGAAARLVAGLALSLLAVPVALGQRRRVREREQRAELERRVGERTADLSRANRQLTAEIHERAAAESHARKLREDLAQANRLATLGQVTAGVAHEINQPLAAIRTYAENAGRFLDRDDRLTASRNMALVVELTDRIEAITGGLRELARRPAGETQRVALTGSVEGALLILGARIREEDVQVETRLADDLFVRADRLRLEQVLVNLLRNALDALRGRPDPLIRIEGRREDARVRLAVSDNGPGIDPAVLDRLFTPFSTTKPQGLGLGLVISQDIVTELGGRLWAEPGASGALFVVDLPAEADA